VVKDIKKIMPDILEVEFDRFVNQFVRYLPKKTTPGQVTIIGFIGAVIAGFSLYLASFNRYFFFLAVIGLFMHLVCDAWDGALARERHMESEAGFILDSFLDNVGLGFCVSLGIALSSYANFTLYMFGIISYLFTMTLEYLEMLTARVWTFPLFGAFEFKVAIMITSVLAFFWPGKILFGLGWFNLFGIPVVAGAYLYVIYGFFALLKEVQDRG